MNLLAPPPLSMESFIVRKQTTSRRSKDLAQTPLAEQENEVQSAQAKYDKSIADFTEALPQDPKYAKAYFNRGRAYFGNGDLDRAIADFTEAIRLDPKDAQAYLLRSAIHQAHGNHDEGLDDWLDAVRLDPTLSKLKPMKAEDFTFEQRPLSDLPKNVDLAYWLGEQNGDDQWQVADEDALIQAAVVNEPDIIVWQDKPLTDLDKKEAVEAYEDKVARNEYEEATTGLLTELGVEL